MRQIGRAQLRSDEAAVVALANQAKAVLGPQAGLPGKPDRFREVPTDVEGLKNADVISAFEPYLREIARKKWWRIGDDPTESDHPLRDLASVVEGCTLAARAGCSDKDALLAIARDGGNYLVWAQEQAGSGVFPFPARRGGNARAFVVAERFLDKVDQTGRLGDVVENGWIFNDLGDGGLQFDNGVCGVAVLDLYRLTGDTTYLKSAKNAADWAMAQPVVPNWNYNSFSVYLLAELFRETGNEDYIQSAVRKTQLGIYPGQLTDGEYAGRWFDPHNAEIAYHYAIVRSLVALAAALKESTPERAQAERSLLLALKARDRDFTSKGIADVESTFDALLLLQQHFPHSRRSIGEAQQAEALRALESYCVAKFRAGYLPVAPGVWGRYLDSVGNN
jgi:hypothetical protein